MTPVEIIIALVILIVSVLLVVVIMLQKDRSEGVGAAYGNIGFEGQRGKSIDNILSRWTKILAIAFGVIIVGANIAVFLLG